MLLPDRPYIFPNRSYSSKVLLFGEHTVLMGSSALAIPYSRYHGRWVEEEMISYDWWQAFIEYIIGLELSSLDKERLEYLLSEGSFFLNIPIGYGLGSSGALTAGIYDFVHSEEVDDLVELQRRLGLIESFFHGKSSGYDPLISFLNRGVRKSATGEISDWSPSVSIGLHCYLLDSGSARVGKDLISQAQQYIRAEPNRYDKIVSLNNQIIDLLDQELDTDTLFNRLNLLSTEQYDKMDFLILPDVKEIWQVTLELEDIAIKICGAGGGGYYLLFSKTEISTFQGYELQEVPLAYQK